MEKIANYTAEQTATLVEGCQAGQTVEALAEVMGKSVRSVIAKLAKEQVYKSKAKTSKDTRVTKAMLISAIAVKFGVEAENLESLEKATKETLEILAGT